MTNFGPLCNTFYTKNQCKNRTDQYRHLKTLCDNSKLIRKNLT